MKRATAESAAGLLRVLANQNRLLLVTHLIQGEYSVGELEQLSGIGQPTLSQQLGILRLAGVVCTRREGKKIYYLSVDPKVKKILRVIQGCFEETE